MGPRTTHRLYRQDLGRGLTTNAQSFASDDRRTVLEDLLADHPIGPERGRTMLGALLFSGEDVHRQVGDLSGGERARLLMGKLALEPTNLLLLDEPTNHLDLPAQEVLEQALKSYTGAIVLVSHDRFLIDAIATETWAIEPGGVIERVTGGYSELQRLRQRRRSPPSPAPVAKPPERGARGRSLAGAQPPARGAQARRLETEIAETEAALAATRTRLLDPATFRDSDVGAQVGREHDRLSGALAELYERWADLADG